ncbi:MAG: OsmC family protein [Phycisphaerae bacterium]|jgi:uncharacterized OsmC-like protein
MATATKTIVNGIDTEAVRNLVEQVKQDPANGLTQWKVATQWKGGTRVDTHVSEFGIGDKCVKRDFRMSIDEPLELGGTNQFANPQEHLFGAMNACIMITYASVCALEGIELEDLRIETEGNIDLRGLFALDPDVKAGYDEIRYKVHIKGDATPEQFQKVHETVLATSPNFYNMANAIPMKPELVVE